MSAAPDRRRRDPLVLMRTDRTGRLALDRVGKPTWRSASRSTLVRHPDASLESLVGDPAMR